MSRMEYWNGNLVKVSDSLLDFLVEHDLIAEEQQEYIEDGNDLPVDLEEVFNENFWEDYVLLENSVWKVDAVEDECGDFRVMNRIDENTLNITMSFYNGGACLSEVCADAYKELLEKEESNE